MAEAKIDVRINASDLEALRALTERMERAAQQTEVLTSLRLPIPPGACRACELKDRTLDDERTSHERTKFELDVSRRDREKVFAALESEREAHEQTKRELDSEREQRREAESDRDDANRILADAPTTEQMNRATALTNKHKLERDMALAEIVALRERLIGTRVALERESAEHFATRVRLRDVLREAAAYAKEAANYAASFDEPESEYAKVAREDAAQYEAESAALGIEVSGGTEAPNEVPAAPESTSTPAQPAATFRRRFLAGDRVRPAAQEIVYLAVLDEDDSGNVAIQIGSRRYVNVGANALELVKPADPAKRNSELAFHFHLWNTSVEPNIMDSVPEFVRIAAQQLLRDPWNDAVVKGSDAVPYGQVRVTGGAK